MHSNDGLKARIEEVEKDLLFYLRKYHELTTKSKFMKAVVDKEIKRLERELRNLESIINQKGSPSHGQRGRYPFDV